MHKNMAYYKRHLLCGLLGYGVVIIWQWKSWQINVFTFLEQFEVSRGMLFLNMIFFFSYLSIMIFHLTNEERPRILHGLGWSEFRSPIPLPSGCAHCWPSSPLCFSLCSPDLSVKSLWRFSSHYCMDKSHLQWARMGSPHGRKQSWQSCLSLWGLFPWTP